MVNGGLESGHTHWWSYVWGPTRRGLKDSSWHFRTAHAWQALSMECTWPVPKDSNGILRADSKFFFPYFTSVLFSPVLLLSMYSLLAIWCIESLPITTVLFNFVSDVWSCWPLHRTKIIADQTQLFINHSWTIAKDAYVKHTVNNLWCYQPIWVIDLGHVSLFKHLTWETTH